MVNEQATNYPMNNVTIVTNNNVTIVRAGTPGESRGERPCHLQTRGSPLYGSDMCAENRKHQEELTGCTKAGRMLEEACWSHN